MFSRVQRIRCASLCAVLLCAGAATAIPFQNGSFETPVLGGSSAYGLGNSSSYLPGWASTTTDNSRGYTQNYLYSSGYAALPVSQGNQAILFNGDGYVTTTLSQTFDTNPGIIYGVIFDLARQPGSTGTPPTIVVQTTGGPALTYTASSTSFVPQGYYFTAPGSSATLTFSQSSGPDLSPMVDNVALQPAVFGAFRNGGFENPVIPTGSQYGLGNSTFLDGWVSTTSNTNPGTPWYQNYLYNPGFDKVAGGNQAVMLNGDGIATTTLSQTFATVPGAEYLVTFALAHQGGATNNPATILLQATGNPAVIYPADSVSFVLKTYSFFAVAPVTTLSFTQSTGPMDYSPELDNVRVEFLPEPASLTLLALGLGALSRRRRAGRRS